MGIRRALLSFFRSREARALILILLLTAVGAVIEPRFLSLRSINSVLLWIPLLVVVACGQAIVIIQGGIDVSVGSILGLTGICIGVMFKAMPGLQLVPAAALSLALGGLLGAFNGFAITKLKVPPIVATLGTLSIYRGLAFVVSKGEQVDSNDLPATLMKWTETGPLQAGGLTISWLLLISVCVALLTGVLLHRTKFGLQSFAMGGNLESAKVRTIPIGRVSFWGFTICGALAGFAGLLYASRYGFVNPASAGYGFELTAIAAVVVGGCSVRGGSGSVLGVLLGCCFLGQLSVGLSVLGIEANFQLLTYGAAILIGLAVDKSFSAKAERRVTAP